MRILAFLFFCFPVLLLAQDKEPITINNADYLDFNKNYANAERLVGHVSMSQGNMTLTCDSAWFWKDENKMEAFGHAFLNQTGGTMVWSDYMLYNGNTKLASAHTIRCNQQNSLLHHRRKHKRRRKYHDQPQRKLPFQNP